VKSPVRAPIQSFAKRYDAVIERAMIEVIDEIGDRVLTSKQIEELVRRVFAKHGVDAKLVKELMSGIVKSVGAGAGVSIGAAQGVAIQRWWMDKAYSPDDKKFSAKINDLSRKTEITGAIRGSMKARDSWRKAAQDLHDRGIQRADVAKDVTELSKRARQAFAQSGDAKGYVEYMRDVKAVQKRIDRLTDPSTSRLKRAYQDVIDAAEKQSEKAMQKAIKYAAFEKERYNAERIARTEMAKAYGDSFITENVNDPDAVGWRAELSDAHKVTDICDFHTSADLYGMGAGVYPKGRGPAYPFHPHCIPEGQRVDFDGLLVAACKSLYCGIVKEIRLASGKEFAVTVNHPVLTSKGWVVAQDLGEGDKVVSCFGGYSPFGGVVSGVAPAKPHDDKRPPRVEDVFRAVKKSRNVIAGKVPSSVEDFHGDGRFIDGDVEVVRSNGLLLSDVKSSISKHGSKFVLGWRNVASSLLASLCSFGKVFGRAVRSTDSVVGSKGDRLAAFRGVVKADEKAGGVTNSATDYVSFAKNFTDDISRDPELVRDALLGLSGLVGFDDVVSVKCRSYFGHVYDLQVEPSQIYITNGVIVKNCTCVLSTVYEGDAPEVKRKKIDDAAGARFLKSVPKEEAQSMLGVEGYAKFKKDPTTWQDNLSNWQGHEVKRASVPLKLLHGE
jgi:hypothetical protein